MKVQSSVVYPFVSIFAFVALLAEPAHADRMALWKIVSLECVPHFEKGEAPVPCEHIDITGGEDRGYVDFKDQRGVAQMLTIPIRRVTGIEDPALQAIAEIVHDIDLKDAKFGREEATGIASLIAGIASANSDDQNRLAQGAPVFDNLYQYFKTKRGR